MFDNKTPKNKMEIDYYSQSNAFNHFDTMVKNIINLENYSFVDNTKKQKQKTFKIRNYPKRVIDAMEGLMMIDNETTTNPLKECANCNKKITPLWRCGKFGNKNVILCNACGLNYSKGQFCDFCHTIYKLKDVENNSYWMFIENKKYVHKVCYKNH